MRLSDFQIGTEFYTCTGQAWRCTDVGRRTIAAIELCPDLEASWFRGPPYAVVEHVFDEHDIEGAYRDEQDFAQDIGDRRDNRQAHPGFALEPVFEMMRAAFAGDALDYPHRRLWRFDRVEEGGEILHPYAAIRHGEQWRILVFRLFENTYQSWDESEFVRLRPATKQDLLLRAQRCSLSAITFEDN